MDLTQLKLTRAEWNSIEIPVQDAEKTILNLIQDGYKNINIKKNNNLSLMSFMKIDNTPEFENYLYKQYFENEIQEITIHLKSNASFSNIMRIIHSPFIKPKVMKKIDLMRLQNTNANIDSQKEYIFEYIQLDLLKSMLSTKKRTTDSPNFALYTLIQFSKSSILKINPILQRVISAIIEWKLSTTPDIISTVFGESYSIIEKNPYLLKYADMTLFDHQKRLFQIFKNSGPKLVLYIAPTGTGKTLSPLGLAVQHRIIFVCAARHVGLALARSAISMEKKVAFAFGCETASDIRLHYYSAADYTTHWKSGGIGKVDNSVGHKVQIMICDIKSYLTAMHYMLSFNAESDIITYWDEPTITMDYETHELHDTIRQIWQENQISKLVLSCATLPKEDEILDTIASFKGKFEGAEIHSIVSYDCRKSIALLNKQMYSVLPHFLFSEYGDVLKSVHHCRNNQSLLRYFDLSEIVRFIKYVDENNYINERFCVSAFFNAVSDITMNSIKLYYLDALQNINAESWSSIHAYICNTRVSKFIPVKKHGNFTKSHSVDSSLSASLSASLYQGKPLERNTSINSYFTSDSLIQGLIQSRPLDDRSAPCIGASLPPIGILITTEDAQTITDGPAIFLTEDPHKIGLFYIQQSKIPSKIFTQIRERIESNNTIQKKMDIIEKQMVDKNGTDNDKEKKMSKDTDSDIVQSNDRFKLQLEALRMEIRAITLDQVYIPNTKPHQSFWVSNDPLAHKSSAFVPTIDEQTVIDIMSLNIDTNMKLLLIMGIGMFVQEFSTKEFSTKEFSTKEFSTKEFSTKESSTKESSTKENTNIDPRYLEIMKRLAYDQQLFLIIASSDYIYGTNYQFAHGILGKDLEQMTQQKTIQAMGRIGRGNIQQEYTVRFRDDAILNRLFLPADKNIEAEVMSKLWC
jgi:hypothetical protein